MVSRGDGPEVKNMCPILILLTMPTVHSSLLLAIPAPKHPIPSSGLHVSLHPRML